MSDEVLPYTINTSLQLKKHPVGPRCEDIHPSNGFVCIRERGHLGSHVAHIIPKGTNKLKKDIPWPQDDGE